MPAHTDETFCRAHRSRERPSTISAKLEAMARYEPHDKFYRKARERGLPSRAAFKIEELIARFKLARAGARVADLGCAPGGWLAILAAPSAAAAGSSASTWPHAPRAPPTWTLSPATSAMQRCARRSRARSARPPISSPAISRRSSAASPIAIRRGSLELLTTALEFAGDAKPGGAMVAKVFMGGEFDASDRSFHARFDKVEVTHTRASRPGSSELYLVRASFAATARGAGPRGTRRRASVKLERMWRAPREPASMSARAGVLAFCRWMRAARRRRAHPARRRSASKSPMSATTTTAARITCSWRIAHAALAADRHRRRRSARHHARTPRH